VATMADVARHAGVSVKTVSNVLSGYPHVRETTRERVRASVDALGYEINVTAKIFRSGRSGVVGLSVPELGQPYFGELADEILSAARRHGLQVLIEPTGFTRVAELAALRVPRGGLVDGLIFSPAALVQDDAHLLDDLGYPLVLLGEQLFSSSVDHVTMRNIDGAQAATDLLLDAGRRSIAAIGMLHAESSGSARLRYTGYSKALEARGIGVDSRLLGWADHGWHRADGARAMAAVLDSGVRVDGVVAFNDALAIGAMYELQARGLAIPQDVGVVGFDDIEDSRYSVPTLTTVDPGRREIANVAVDILRRRLQESQRPGAERGSPVLYLAGMRLVERESTPRRAR
jgi:DNA-binding LacI/PurR family transcriptional regulator